MFRKPNNYCVKKFHKIHRKGPVAKSFLVMLQPTTLLKKKSMTFNFGKILKTIILCDTCEELLLKVLLVRAKLNEKVHN